MKRAPLLLFVCTGNICRSPMAAAVAQDMAMRRHMDLQVASAGTAALDGNPATDGARRAMTEIGLDISAHRAQQIEAALLREAALVVAATSAHRSFLRSLMPGAAAKIVSFDDLAHLGDIADPIYGGADEYRGVRSMLLAGMPRVLDAVIAGATQQLQVAKDAKEN